MIKRAKAEGAGTLADLTIQMWTDHDPEDPEEEFHKLAINDEATCFIKILMINRLLLHSVGCGTIM